jgi:hypothetical protein
LRGVLRIVIHNDDDLTIQKNTNEKKWEIDVVEVEELKVKWSLPWVATNKIKLKPFLSNFVINK